jgi:tRNA threonylcarbamoyladenosine biosynthesis protein TsaE
MLTYYPSSPEEMAQLAKTIAESLRPGAVLCFFGDLGAGKTTFIKALADGLGISELLVNSPTFQYLNIYQGRLPLYHFDLYRLRSAEDFVHSGFDEFFFKEGITCIEWAEKIADIIPSHATKITISHLGENLRKVEISLPSWK